MKEKKCERCQETKPLTSENFKLYVRGTGLTKHLDDGTGYAKVCNQCKQSHAKEQQRIWRENNRQYMADKRRQAKEAREAERRSWLHPTDGIPWGATTTL